MKIIEFHVRIKTITKNIEFSWRLMKIIKILKLYKKITKNHENVTISFENHENYEKNH